MIQVDTNDLLLFPLLYTQVHNLASRNSFGFPIVEIPLETFCFSLSVKWNKGTAGFHSKFCNRLFILPIISPSFLGIFQTRPTSKN